MPLSVHAVCSLFTTIPFYYYYYCLCDDTRNTIAQRSERRNATRHTQQTHASQMPWIIHKTKRGKTTTDDVRCRPTIYSHCCDFSYWSRHQAVVFALCTPTHRLAAVDTIWWGWSGGGGDDGVDGGTGGVTEQKTNSFNYFCVFYFSVCAVRARARHFLPTSSIGSTESDCA